MKHKPSKISRFLSLNQHRKRLGARRHLTANLDLASLKDTLIDVGDPKQTRGSAKSLDQHLEDLRKEFSGKPELLWHHAKLIVLIRREFQTEKTYQELREIWDREQAFLCANLNIRWLVAATDSMAEHDPDPTVRSVAMMTSLFVNTVKMYESERFVTGAEQASLDQDRLDRLQTELVPLFEGMSSFTVGTDDTLRNLIWRLRPFLETPPAGPILREIWSRMQIEDSVFARMRALHHRKKTMWWEDDPR